MKLKILFTILLSGVLPAALLAKTEVKIHFSNVVGHQQLVLNDSAYTNANGDSYTLSMCKYYISNISFVSAEGKTIGVPESYHLVNEAKPSSKNYSIHTIPPGSYTAIKFMIGVDSLHNVSGAQGGELDPINAMFWDWNTGYIMAKIEGNSKAAPDGEIAYHIGGFSGATSALKWVTIKFPKPLKIAENKIPVINLHADISEWFKTPVKIEFSKNPVITTESKEAVMIADNYADMFTLQSIEE